MGDAHTAKAHVAAAGTGGLCAPEEGVKSAGTCSATSVSSSNGRPKSRAMQDKKGSSSKRARRLGEEEAAKASERWFDNRNYKRTKMYCEKKSRQVESDDPEVESPFDSSMLFPSPRMSRSQTKEWRNCTPKTKDVDLSNTLFLKPIPGFTVSHFTTDDIPNVVASRVFSITKANMARLYCDSAGASWESWDDTSKFKELVCTPGMQFIVFYSQSIDEEKQCPWALCNRVLNGIIAKVAREIHEENGPENIIGFIAFRCVVESRIPLLYLHEIHLVPGARRKGVGTFVMSHIESIGRKLSSKLIMLTALRSNKDANEFYGKLDFSVDEACPSFVNQDKTTSYCILSKALDEEILRHTCIQCDARFRFPESLEMHSCLEHDVPFPFRCGEEGCKLGTVRDYTFKAHMRSHRGRKFESRQIESKVDVLFHRVSSKTDGKCGIIWDVSPGNMFKVRLDGRHPKFHEMHRCDLVLQMPKNPI